MSQLIQKRFRILTLIILILILGTASYGFAATNTIADAGKAGEGDEAISGYAVSSVQYTLDSNDPTAFDSVSFDLDTAATSVFAGLEDPATNLEWGAACTTSDNISFSCDLTSVTITVANATRLHVAAGQ
jgi:hypothetical protein